MAVCHTYFLSAGEAVMSFELRSSAFQQNLSIPTKYTCDGANVSVPLSWRDAPRETKSFALIVDDPDAPNGIWVHWVLYDLPEGGHALAEAIPNQETLGNGAKQGVNDFGKSGTSALARVVWHIATFSNCMLWIG